MQVTVPDQPSAEEIKQAVELLLNVVADFPFETPAHQASWLASLLTPLAWFAFDGPAPLFLVDGNTRGVGKGLLMDVVGVILTGDRFPIMAYSNESEELRKRITSLAVEAERLILLDNLSGPFGNAVLDAVLTTGRWKDRLLGFNRNYDGPLNLTWFATGNNVQLIGDISRRILHIRLETPYEKPELRMDFQHPDLNLYVQSQRSQLLSAALTILRGWYIAGRPRHGLKNWGSFQNWSDVVRECVVFAGLRFRLSPTVDINASNWNPMTPSDYSLTRSEIATLLAHVIHRMIRHPQNLAPSDQDCLDVLPKEVLSVTKTVNTHGEPGEA